MLLTAYYLLLGVGAVSNVLAPLFKLLFPFLSRSKPFQVVIPIPFKDPIELKFDNFDLIGAVIGAVLAVYYFITKNWIANNVFGEAFSILSIEMISLGSFSVGCVLLGGLFFYDIFWVFGTDVMETVAKSFEGPIKVLWPRGEGKFSLLGLGDIVIPGFFISLMLRFDAHLAKKNGTQNKQLYFHVCFAAYIVSLILTVTVLHFFKKGQPALLYIVPLIVGSVVVLALARGEFKDLIGYEEHPEVVVKPKAE
jgi:minor histocompatibility antigen H13